MAVRLGSAASGHRNSSVRASATTSRKQAAPSMVRPTTEARRDNPSSLPIRDRATRRRFREDDKVGRAAR